MNRFGSGNNKCHCATVVHCNAVELRNTSILRSSHPHHHPKRMVPAHQATTPGTIPGELSPMVFDGFLGRAYFGKPRASWKLREKVKSVASWTLLPHLTTPLKVKRVASRCIKSVTSWILLPRPTSPTQTSKTWRNMNKPTRPSKNGAHSTYMWFSHIWVIAFILYLWKATKNQRRLMGPSYIIYTFV